MASTFFLHEEGGYPWIYGNVDKIIGIREV